jgi:hypothetical protein
MQCFVFDGLGDGLGSGDEDGSGLEDEPVGVLGAAVGVDPVVCGLALRLSAGSGCRWVTTRARPGPGVCVWCLVAP